MHDPVVEVGDRLDQVVAVLADLVLHAGWDLERLGALGAQVVGVDDRLLAEQVDVALEVRLGADRQLDRNRPRAQARSDRVQRPIKVSSDPIHLVDEGDPRHPVAVGLAPDRLRLRLDARDRVKDRDRPIQHPQRALDFDREVHVPGCVYDVDRVVAPHGGRGCRRDRDPALLLLDHPVHGRGALVHLAHLVDAARVKKDALGRRRLTRVDVRHDSDVSDFLDRGWTLLHFQCQVHISSTGSVTTPRNVRFRGDPGYVLRYVIPSSFLST